MTKYQKYCKAVKFVRTVKKQTLDNGVTIEPFSINKTAKEAASL